MDTRHHSHMLADPNVIADNGVALQRQLIFHRRNGAPPVSAHYVKRIGGHTVHPMIGAVHDELDALGDGAEFPDNQFVADEIIEVCDMLLELIGTVYIIIVRVIPDDDPRILHHILDVAKAGNLRIWECYIRIGPVGYLVLIPF